MKKRRSEERRIKKNVCMCVYVRLLAVIERKTQKFNFPTTTQSEWVCVCVDKGENFATMKPRHVHLNTFTKNLGIMPIHLFICACRPPTSSSSLYIECVCINGCMSARVLYWNRKWTRLAKKRLGGGLIWVHVRALFTTPTADDATTLSHGMEQEQVLCAIYLKHDSTFSCWLPFILWKKYFVLTKCMCFLQVNLLKEFSSQSCENSNWGY